MRYGTASLRSDQAEGERIVRALIERVAERDLLRQHRDRQQQRTGRDQQREVAPAQRGKGIGAHAASVAACRRSRRLG
jgi:hypothetical protein